MGPRTGTLRATGPPRRSVRYWVTASTSAGMVGTSTWRGTPEGGSAYTSTRIRSISSAGVRSSTLSTKRAERPTTLPDRTWKTWTAASSSSSARPNTSRSSGRSSSIWRTASAARTASSLSRRTEARSNSRAPAASRMSASSSRSSGPVSPLRKEIEVGHQAVVLGVVDGPHARARAPLDVVEQAGPAQPLVAPELGVGAGPHRKRPQQQVEGLPDGPDVRDRGRSTGPRCASDPGPPPAGATRR